MMTQFDTITKYMIGPPLRGSHKNVNVVGAIVNNKDANFEVFYNIEL